MARAITFDLWHTLLYLEPREEEAYMRQQWELGVRALLPRRTPVSRAIHGTFRKAFRVAYAEAVENAGEGISVSPSEQVRRAAKRLGVRGRPSEYVKGLSQLVATSPFRRTDGALEVLEELHKLGFRIGVISNTVGEPGRFLRRVCDQMGISAKVDDFTWSDELPWTKPSPEIFQHCLDRLKVTAQNAVHVGDGAADVGGARATGYRATILFTGLHFYGESYRKLFMPGDSAKPSSDYSVRTLAGIPAIVRRVFALH